MRLFSTRTARHLNEWLGKITGPPSLKVSKTQWDCFLLGIIWVNVPHCHPQVQVMNVSQNHRPAPHLKQTSCLHVISLEMSQEGLSWDCSPLNLLILLTSLWSETTHRKGRPSEACSELPPPTWPMPWVSAADRISPQQPARPLGQAKRDGGPMGGKGVK